MATSPSHLELTLVPFAEEHHAAVAHIHLAAMKDDKGFNKGWPLALRPSYEKRIEHNILLRSKAVSPSTHQVVALLPGSPSRVVGFVKWVGPVDSTVTFGRPTEAEMLASRKAEKSEQEKEIEATMDVELFAIVGERSDLVRREVLEGKKHWYLAHLIVDPAYQGMGVGSALLNYGLSRADAAGLPTYLESSLPGRAVYAAKGFEIVRWSEIDDETEEEGKLRWPHMLRAAKRAPNPLVVLSTAIKPEYYPALAVQQIEAFKTTRISLRMWPEASRPSLEKRIAWDVLTRTKHASEPPADLLEVVALVDGQPAGLATWSRPVDRTSTRGDPLPEEKAAKEILEKRMKEEWQKEMENAMDGAFVKEFTGEMDRVRKEWSNGRRHWYLKFLFVDPARNGLGIGSQLLDWGVKQAEAERLPCWLEATDSGRLLYDRRGWKVVSWCEVPDKESEGGIFRWPGMCLGNFES